MKRTIKYAVVAFLLLLTACGSKSSAEYTDLTEKDAVELAIAWNDMDELIQAGGLYKEGEYKTFVHRGLDYRYMAFHLDSKKKMKSELRMFVTKKKAKRYMKENGMIKHDGKLASPEMEAPANSLLQWDTATARKLKSKKRKMTFELTIPIGDTRTAESILVSYVFVKKAGWRIDKYDE